MKTWRGILFIAFTLAALLGCVKAKPPTTATCLGNYQPEHSMTMPRFQRLSQNYDDLLMADRPLRKALNHWNHAINKEITPALIELFTHPCTNVFYGEFTDPKERELGVYDAQDDAAGLRVIWQLYFDVPTQTPGVYNQHLISAITFWKYDFKTEKMQQMYGPDALRARVEIQKGEDLVGLSYQLEETPELTIHRAFPGEYIDDKGNDLYKNITDVATTGHCISCHRHQRSKFERAFASKPVESMPGHVEFLKYLQEHRVSSVRVEELKKTLASPKVSFQPKGLLEALKKSR